MHVQVAELRRATSALRWRTVLLAVFGALTAAFALFWIVVGVAMTLSPNNDKDITAGVICGLLGGVLPAVPAILMIVFAIHARRRATQLEKIAWIARDLADADGLQKAFSSSTGASASASAALVRDAWSMGILAHERPAPAAAPFAATALSPAPGSPMPRGPAAGSPMPGAPMPATPMPGAPMPEQPAASMVGRVLNGTYRIERHLGNGAMGSVWVARHLRTGGALAVKTLHPDARMSQESIARFRLEATAASAIGHEGIVRVHDFDATWDGVYFIAMDLLDGETLEQRLAAVGRLPFQEARRISVEIGSALHAAHSVGVLHRDLKPANVFLRAARPGMAERAVLLDFGLAKPLGQAMTKLTTTGAALGTPAYMSPEQARGNAVDVRSDVYALGALLYEMVMGEPPFLAPTVAALFAKLLTEPAQVGSLPEDCPRGLADVLTRALAKEPADRFQDVPSFLTALQSADILSSGTTERFGDDPGSADCA
jgi:serine/threonine-protein kinase